MFSSTLNERLKEYLYKNLRENPEQNLPTVIKRTLKDLESADHEKVKDTLRVIKHMIKDKMPAKPKFYGLILLKEMMETKERNLVDYFTKKMLNRLFYLAQFESKNKDDLSRGERCLKRYYGQDSKENREYSLKFFILLLECWKHWDEMLGPTNKKIKQKTDKLRHLFPLNDLYYNYLDKSYKHATEMQPHSPTPRLSMERMRDSMREPLNMSKSYESHNHTLSESMHRSEEIQKKVLTFYQIREALFPVVRENEAEEIEEILQDLYHSLKTQLEILQRHKSKVMQSHRYSEKFRVRFLRETDIATSIIELFDKYYSGTINYQNFQREIRELEDDIQKKSLEKFSIAGRDERGGNFGTISSLNDSEPLESSRKMARLPEPRTDPKSNGNISKSMPSVSVKASPKELHKRQKSDEKYGNGFEKSTDVIREVKEEDEEYDDNFDDDKWKQFSDFKAPDSGKNSQWTFENTKKSATKLQSPDYNYEPRNSQDNIESDFNDFNEKLVTHRFNNSNQMATIDEESRDDYESKLSVTRGPQDSRVTTKGMNKNAKDNSFKHRTNTEIKDAPSDIGFDDFHDFVFKPAGPTADDKEWLNFGQQNTQTKSSRVLTEPKLETHVSRRSDDMTRSSKEMAQSFKKPGFESKSQQHLPKKSTQPATSTPTPKKVQKQYIPDTSVVSHQEDDIMHNFSNFNKPSTGKKEYPAQKTISFTEREERLPTYDSNNSKEQNKPSLVRRQSDDEFESFQENQNHSADIDPFSQFKVTHNVSQDNSEINRNLESNMMTFGMEHFNSVMDMQKKSTYNNSHMENVAFTDVEVEGLEQDEPLDENAFEFQFETNDRDEPKEDFEFGFGDNFASPHFDRSMEHNMLKMQDYGDDQPFSAYSNERKAVEIPSIKTQLQSPTKTKIVKVPVSIAKELKMPMEEIEVMKIHIPETPEVAEREITDLRIQKEHYRQQCDFLFSKLLALQKDQNKHRMTRAQDQSINSANVPDEDELDIYQNKIINRRNDYLQKENLMLKKLNKDLVESNNAMVDKKEVENTLLKKLVNEMEAYVMELQDTLGKISRS